MRFWEKACLVQAFFVPVIEGLNLKRERHDKTDRSFLTKTSGCKPVYMHYYCPYAY